VNALPPPGWFPDPTGRGDRRYWDGARWTVTVDLDRAQFLDPLPDDPTPGPRLGPPHADLPAEAFAQTGAAAGSLVLCRRRKMSLVDLYPSWSMHESDGRWLGGARFVTVTDPANLNARQIRVADGAGAETFTLEMDPPAAAVRLLIGGAERGAISRQRRPKFGIAIDGRSAGGAEPSAGWGRLHITAADGAPLATATKVASKLARAWAKRAEWFPERVVDGDRSLTTLAAVLAMDPFLIDLVHAPG